MHPWVTTSVPHVMTPTGPGRGDVQAVQERVKHLSVARRISRSRVRRQSVERNDCLAP